MDSRFKIILLSLLVLNVNGDDPPKEIPNSEFVGKIPQEENANEEFPGYDFIKSITVSKSVYFTNSRRKRAIISKEGICDFNPDGFSSCTPDCSGKILCKSGKVHSITRCPERTPFCDQDLKTCVKEIDFCVYNSSLDIQADPPGYSYCDGRYSPDLKDCRMFSYCEDTYFYKYRCKGVSAFDPIKQICSTKVKCYSFGDSGLCKGANLGTVAYPLDKSRFVICSANDTPYLGDCNYFGNNEINSTYDPRTSKCELNCVEEGRYDDPNDLSADYRTYIECIYDNKTKTVKGYTRVCPVGTNYDVNDKICRQFPSLLQLREKIPILRHDCNNSIYSKACSLLGHVSYDDYLSKNPDFQGTRVACSEKTEDGYYKHFLFKCNSGIFKNENYLPQCENSKILGCSTNVTRFIGNIEYSSTMDKYLLLYDCTGDGIYKGVDVKFKACPGKNGINFQDKKNEKVKDVMDRKPEKYQNNFWKQFMKIT